MEEHHVDHMTRAQLIITVVLLAAITVTALATGSVMFTGEPLRTASEMFYGADAPLMNSPMVEALVSPITGVVIAIILLMSYAKEKLIDSFQARLFLNVLGLLVLLAITGFIAYVGYLPARA